MKMKRAALGILAVLCAFCLVGNGWSGEDKTPFTGTVTIIHVNDVHTNINETDKAIGYAKIAKFVEKMKAENPNTLFLDNGDTFSGTESSAVDKAESLMPIINTVGIDVMVTGNHDFSYGTQHLLKLAGMLDHPVLCANMIKKDTGRPVLDAYAIKTLPNGMNVAVIGLTTPTSAAMGAADLMYIDAVDTGRILVDAVKPRADVIIGLCHIGDVEGDAMTSMMVARGVPGLDLVIDGHSHTKLPEGRIENGVLIAQTGEYCQNIGVVDLTFKDGKMVDSKARLISREDMAGFPEKESTASLIRDFNAMSDKHFAQVVGETSVHLDGSRKNIRTGETNMGSYFADVMTEAAGAQVGMFKAGPIGGDVKPGPITRKDLVSMARVNSMIIVKEVKGRDIVEFLNFSSGSYPNPSGSFQQVSGISFKLNPEGGADKVLDVRVGGEPIDPDRTYTVATIMGSDEEPGLRNGKFIREVEYSMELLDRHISANSPIAPKTDGRIATVGK